MDLMNSLPLLKMDLTSTSQPKQDPKLIVAIDRLFNSSLTGDSKDDKVLPQRKLEFSELLDLMKQTPTENEISDDLMKQSTDKRKQVLRKIESILGDINKSAEEGEVPKLVIRNQRLWSNCVYDLDRVALKDTSKAKTTTVRYSNAEDKSRFNTIVFVLSKVHELLTKNLTVTRRELYYQNVGRFRNQADLDVGVRDVCCLLETPPWDIGIVATAKGLVAGPLTLVHRDGTVTDCSGTGGTLIPQDIDGIKEFKSSAKYILVVEKDAVFQKLLDEGALVRLRPVILMTPVCITRQGKGYPDVCSRRLLRRLAAAARPALALVDADPHGYEIFLTYKYEHFGQAQSHLSASLACRRLRLVGARPADARALAPAARRLALSAADRRKLTALLTRPYLNTATGLQIKQELKAMLDSGIKVEIEALASSAAALCDSYLPSKIIQAEYLG